MMMDRHLRPCRCNPCHVGSEDEPLLAVEVDEYRCVHHIELPDNLDTCIGHYYVCSK